MCPTNEGSDVQILRDSAKAQSRLEHREVSWPPGLVISAADSTVDVIPSVLTVEMLKEVDTKRPLCLPALFGFSVLQLQLAAGKVQQSHSHPVLSECRSRRGEECTAASTGPIPGVLFI